MTNLNFFLKMAFLLLFLSFCPTMVSAQDADADGISDRQDLDDDNDGIIDIQECNLTSLYIVNWWNNSNAFSGDVQTGFTTADISPQNSTAGTGLTRVWNSGAFQQISQINATTESQAIANNEYVEYKVTTGTKYIAVSQLEYYISPSGNSNNTYNYTLRISDDNFSTNNLVHGAQNYVASTGGSNFLVNTLQVEYLYPNKTYTFRVYFYNVSGGAASTIAHDDFKLRGNFECDSDSDNIPNRLDLDSDGDGCFDAIEGDENVLLNQLTSGRINITTTGGMGTTAGVNNGVPNLVNSGGSADIGGDVGQGIGDSQNISAKSQCTDSDNDSVQDTLDLDDDNDGILDVNETVCINSNNASFNPLTQAWQSTGLSIVSGRTYKMSLFGSTLGLVTASGGPNNGKQFYPAGFGSGNSSVSDYNGYRYNLPTGSSTATYLSDPAPSQAITFANLTASDYQSVLTFVGMIDTNGNGQYNPGIDILIPNLLSMSEGASGGIVFNAPVGGTFYIVYTDTAYSDNYGTLSFSMQSCGVDTDFDGDGIPSRLDLDSDGDGCTDAIEGGSNFNNANLVTATGSISSQTPNQNLGNTVGSTATTMGVPTIAGSGQSIGQSQQAFRNDCVDSDNDGIPDWQDLDDDNDGILDTVECGFICPTTFNNGGFESPVVSSFAYINQTDPTVSWKTTSSDGLIEIWKTGFNGVPSAEGSQFAEINATQVATLYQTFCVNGLGGTVNWSIKHRGRGGVDVAAVKFGTSLAGAQAASASATMSDGNTAWGSYSGTYTIPVGTTTLVVALQAVSTSDNNNSAGNFIDDVQLNVSQVCLDTDGDGIPNYLDLDSDGDGCTDAIEGGANFTSANLVTATGNISTQTPNQNLGNTVGNTATTMGVPAIASTGQSVGQSQQAFRNDCVDSDGDGIPDWQDLDDDNDGILDTVECPTNNIFANLTPATISSPNSTTTNISGISFGGLTGSLAVSNFGTTFVNNISKSTTNMSNAIIYTPAGGTAQSVLTEAESNFNNTSNFTRYTLTLSAPVESITLHIVDFDFMRTRFTGNHVEQLISGGTELVYNTSTRQLYDSDPTTFSNNLRDGYGSIKITSKNGQPLNQIVFEKFDDPISSEPGDGYAYTFSVEYSCDFDGDGIPNRLDLDSDNDGCLDAIEGDENVTSSQLVNATSGLSVGSGSTAMNQNLCSSNTCVDANGVPTVINSGGAADIGGDQGQGIGDSQNALVNGCICYADPGLVTGQTYPVKHGITALSRAGVENGNWPMLRNSAYTALESKTKGFVITRNNSPETTVTIPVVGMMVFDTDENAGKGCLKIYTGSASGEGWKCYTTPTCP